MPCRARAQTAAVARELDWRRWLAPSAWRQ